MVGGEDVRAASPRLATWHVGIALPRRLHLLEQSLGHLPRQREREEGRPEKIVTGGERETLGREGERGDHGKRERERESSWKSGGSGIRKF